MSRIGRSPTAGTAAHHASGGTVDAAATVDAYMPLADGPGLVNEGSTYPLGLFGTSSTTHWGVNWGDGTTDAIAGTPSAATHVFAAGGVTYAVWPTAYDADGTATPAPAVPVAVVDVPATLAAHGDPDGHGRPAGHAVGPVHRPRHGRDAHRRRGVGRRHRRPLAPDGRRVGRVGHGD